MSDENQTTKKRDRSPAFPYVGLRKAVDYSEMLLRQAQRHPVRLMDAASAWGLKPKSSSTLRIAAALNAFGLTEESGSGLTRRVAVSEDARRIIEDTRSGVRELLLQEAALKPAMISQYFQKWGTRRPDDQFALSELKFESNFTDEGANKFLRIFDETIKFANLITHHPENSESLGENIYAHDDVPSASKVTYEIADLLGEDPTQSDVRQTAPVHSLKSDERELMSGMLSKKSTFKLIVSGIIGPRELDKLIAKIQIDKDILLDDEGG